MIRQEPVAKTGSFSASVNSTFYLWGGYTDGNTQHLAKIYSLDHSSPTWRSHNIREELPSGYYAGACTSIGPFLYSYGGWSQNGMETGGLFEFSTQTLSWKELAPAEAEGGPMKKIQAGMISYNKKLYLFGGYSNSSHLVQSGSQFVLGFTNEFHSYDLRTGDLLHLLKLYKAINFLCLSIGQNVSVDSIGIAS